MVDSLPDDSATVRAEIGEDAAWTIEGQLLAALVEQIDAQTRWMVALLATEKNHHAKRFLKRRQHRIPRPGVEEGDRKWNNRRGTTLGELVGMMGGKTEV